MASEKDLELLELQTSELTHKLWDVLKHSHSGVIMLAASMAATMIVQRTGGGDDVYKATESESENLAKYLAAKVAGRIAPHADQGVEKMREKRPKN